MKKIMLVALALTFAAPAFAARPNTKNLTCRDAAGLVAQNGAIVLSTGANTYDRFVAHQGYCGKEEVISPAFVKTLDNKQCFIGYTCEQNGSNGNRSHGGDQAVCREGASEISLEDNGGEGLSQVYRVCKSGKWVTPYKSSPAPVRNPAPVCRDGAEQVLAVDNGSEGGLSQQVFVCRSGKWTPKY